MTTTQKTLTISIVILTLILLFFTYEKNIISVTDVATSTQTPSVEKMILTVFIQDKKAAEISDCGVTQKVTYEIPRTTGVANASLKLLFENELAQYGEYDSVTIENAIAKVKLKNEIPSLSSCQVGHLTSVLTDTLTQYSTIKSVELYSPTQKIEF